MSTDKRFGRTAAMVAATVFIGGAMASGARAADLAGPASAAAPVSEPVVEWGSGWYLRGDLGMADDKRDPMMRMPGALTSTSASSAALSGDVGVGYQFNSVFRSDVTAGFRRNFSQTLRSDDQCVVNAKAVTNSSGTVTGSTPVYDACKATGRVKLTRYPILANAYFDLGNYGGFRPYIGAGVGVALVTSRYDRTELRSDGTSYNVSFTDPYSGQSVSLNNNVSGKKARMNVAYALMAGVAYDISDGLAVDVGYRFMDMGKLNIPGVASNARLTSHEARVGLRYRID